METSVISTQKPQAKKALSVLMMSPFYFKIELKARKTLLMEFCSIIKLTTN